MSVSESAINKFKSLRSKSFTLVLNDDERNLLKDSRYIYTSIFFSNLPVNYIAVIKHDMDRNEYNDLKTLHYHIVLVFTSTMRIGTLINYLLEIFEGLRENQITIDKCINVCSQTRYLIHLDDFDKFKYCSDLIETNDRERVEGFLKAVVSIKDVNDLIALTRQYTNLVELIRVLGIDNYKKYRLVIKDLRDWGGYH